MRIFAAAMLIGLSASAVTNASAGTVTIPDVENHSWCGYSTSKKIFFRHTWGGAPLRNLLMHGLHSDGTPNGSPLPESYTYTPTQRPDGTLKIQYNRQDAPPPFIIIGMQNVKGPDGQVVVQLITDATASTGFVFNQCDNVPYFLPPVRQ
jgi:hypothetical protein